MKQMNPHSVNLGELLILSGPQFLHLYKGACEDMIFIKTLADCRSIEGYSINGKLLRKALIGSLLVGLLNP